MKVNLFDNSSQMIGPKGPKFSGLDRDHPGLGLRKFSDDWS